AHCAAFFFSGSAASEGRARGGAGHGASRSTVRCRGEGRRVRPACSANVLRPPPAAGGLLLEVAAQAGRPRRQVAPEGGARLSPSKVAGWRTTPGHGVAFRV